MADVKISEFTASTATAIAGIEIPINEAGTSKKITMTQLADLLGFYKAVLASSHAITSTTATEAMSVAIPAAGTYWYEMFVIVESALLTEGVYLGVNYTGTVTAARCRHELWFVSTGTTAGTAIPDDTGGIAGQDVEASHQTAFSTTAPNLQMLGVAAGDVSMPIYITGILTATASGDLELWHGCETGGAETRVMAGTAIIVTRVA
jgi:hypothetical protein